MVVDASWEVGHSVSGMALIVAGAAAQWVSRKQAITSMSSMDAETYAAAAAAADMIHLRGLLQELGVPCMEVPTPMWSDNSGTVNVANDSGSVGRSRHLAMRAKFLQDCKELGITRVGYIATNDNPADLLTKPLDRAKFQKHRAYLMGLESEDRDVGHPGASERKAGSTPEDK